MKIRTSKELEEWSFSVNNSGNSNDISIKVEEESDATIVLDDDEEVECLKEEVIEEEDLQKENLKENNCSLKCKVKSVEERIKVLEADSEKTDYSMELIKTKVDLQDQMLKQILFLQNNSQKRGSEHKLAMLKMANEKAFL
uniref:Uncharacterized protein n=1 Tax=Meloidogyne enterolobii TaxID=390850 RepID=A0A6V7THQ3_MELEN|nr:unnamed protein product [Meloidogyne enterolobii]